MKIVRLTSPLTDVLRLSSPRPRLRHGRRLAFLSRPNLTLNLCTLPFVLSLALLPYLPPLLICQTVPFTGIWFRSPTTAQDLTFLPLSQRPYVAEPGATFSSSAEPRALRSFSRPFAPASPHLNFLRLPLISDPLILPLTS